MGGWSLKFLGAQVASLQQDYRYESLDPLIKLTTPELDSEASKPNNKTKLEN
jgi:hypothetical protein